MSLLLGKYSYIAESFQCTGCGISTRGRGAKYRSDFWIYSVQRERIWLDESEMHGVS